MWDSDSYYDTSSDRSEDYFNPRLQGHQPASRTNSLEGSVSIGSTLKGFVSSPSSPLSSNATIRERSADGSSSDSNTSSSSLNLSGIGSSVPDGTDSNDTGHRVNTPTSSDSADEPLNLPGSVMTRLGTPPLVEAVTAADSDDVEMLHVAGMSRRKRKKMAKKERALARKREFFEALQDYEVGDTPPATPPFFHDILGAILLFVSPDIRTLLAVSQTCRTWRFFANYLPIWRHYQSSYTGVRWFPTPVKDTMRTRDDCVGDVVRLAHDRRSSRQHRTAKTVLWQAFHLVLLYGLLAATYFMSWYIGYGRSSLDTDGEVGSLAFFCIFFLLCIVLYLLGLVMDDSQSRTIDFRRFIILAGFVLVVLVLGTPVALVGVRTKVAEFIALMTPVDVRRIPQLKCSDWFEMTPMPYVSLDVPLSEWQLNTTNTVRVDSNFSLTTTTFYYAGIPYTHYYRYIPTENIEVSWRDRGCGYINATMMRVDIALYGVNVTLSPEALKSLSFRSYFDTEYFNDLGGKVRWYTASNWLWREWRAYLVNADWPTNQTEAVDRVERFYGYRNALLIAGGYICGFFYLLSCSFCFSKDSFSTVTGISWIIVAAAVNPIVLIVIGGLCTISGPSHPSLLMCDASAGGGMIFVGTFWIFIAIISACSED